MSLYLWINLLSLSVPFLVSFHPKIKLYKRWGALFLAIATTAIPYLVWDAIFTDRGYWGFNSAYLLNIYMFKLPLEEWLFFFCIPYACIFTHQSLSILFPKAILSRQATLATTAVLLAVFALLAMFNAGKAYTLVNAIFAFVILAATTWLKPQLLSRYYFTFPFMLIPFFIVNGVLTGTGIENEIVWYNNAENLGIRMLTIPVEDSIYAFSMILGSLVLFALFDKSEPSH